MRRSVLLLALGCVVVALAAAPSIQPAPGASEPSKPQSDERAIKLAEATLEAMGGREAWERTRHLKWNFFGMRKHLWDKHTGRARIDATTRDGTKILALIDLDDKTGRIWKDGQEITEPTERDRFLNMAHGWWINDSYWLLMPYKLRDPGVTLAYKGEGEMEAGEPADIIALTFERVGLTPQNKYHVWIARESGLVEQWAFYESASDPEPQFITPWKDWREYGGIKLSGDRGEMNGRAMKLTEIAVYDELPDEVFTSPEPPDFPEHQNSVKLEAPRP